MSGKESPEARAGRLIAELRAATSEAAGMLKDLRAALTQARTIVPTLVSTHLLNQVVPVLQAFDEQLTETLHATDLEIRDRFNNTSNELEAVLNDLVKTGNIYKLGMPIVEGSENVRKMIKEVVERNR